MTLVCVPIMVDEPAVALALAQRAREAGADIVEFRIDRLFEGAGDVEGLRAVIGLVDGSPLPCIVTCRASSEGGEYDGDDAGRVALWEHLGIVGAGATSLHPTSPPRYIDVEQASYARSANLRQKVHLAVDHPDQGRDGAPGLILSAHDFNARPANLARLLADMRSGTRARVLKIAWRARSLRDNLEAFDILRERDRPTIALCMGEFGLMSRVLAPKFGGFLTFASLTDSSVTAPGQPTVKQLLELFRFRGIGPATRVYGVIGYPLEHSLSPLLHNAGFDAGAGHDGVYLPLPVPAEWEHFKATLLALLDHAPLHFRGASVTLPHKEHLVRLAREDRSRTWRLDALSQRCGAANTLVVQDDGSCDVLNSDGPAAALALERAGVELPGLRVGVIGAGGVARAVAAGLMDKGATVVIYNRSAERADALVRQLATPAGPGKIVAAPIGNLEKSCCQVFVNCTPLGMRGGPAPEQLAVPADQLAACGSGTVVFDTVYNPVQTPLLRAAAQAGLTRVDGVTMFVEQAAIQHEAWTGRPAARQMFDRLIRETLSAPPS
ncbi:MAG: type I 3-dehydroquinate dehydratase [Planctomycetota bacterium]|nr:type I 3-dehydroquinate dehydratase [Planctomycetota bacterium]